jgi:hypothetical protein
LSRIYNTPLIDRAYQDDYNGGIIEIVVKIKIAMTIICHALSRLIIVSLHLNFGGFTTPHPGKQPQPWIRRRAPLHGMVHAWVGQKTRKRDIFTSFYDVRFVKDLR